MVGVGYTIKEADEPAGAVSASLAPPVHSEKANLALLGRSHRGRGQASLTAHQCPTHIPCHLNARTAVGGPLSCPTTFRSQIRWKFPGLFKKPQELGAGPVGAHCSPILRPVLTLKEVTGWEAVLAVEGQCQGPQGCALLGRLVFRLHRHPPL